MFVLTCKQIIFAIYLASSRHTSRAALRLGVGQSSIQRMLRTSDQALHVSTEGCFCLTSFRLKPANNLKSVKEKLYEASEHLLHRLFTGGEYKCSLPDRLELAFHGVWCFSSLVSLTPSCYVVCHGQILFRETCVNSTTRRRSATVVKLHKLLPK